VANAITLAPALAILAMKVRYRQSSGPGVTSPEPLGDYPLRQTGTHPYHFPSEKRTIVLFI